MEGDGAGGTRVSQTRSARCAGAVWPRSLHRHAAGVRRPCNEALKTRAERCAALGSRLKAVDPAGPADPPGPGWVLESEGADAVTMRRVADELGVRAASLYKHLPETPAAVEAAIILRRVRRGEPPRWPGRGGRGRRAADRVLVTRTGRFVADAPA